MSSSDGIGLGSKLVSAYRNHMIGDKTSYWKEEEMKNDAKSFWKAVQESLPDSLKFEEEEMRLIEKDPVEAANWMMAYLSFALHPELQRLGYEFHLRK